LHLSDLLLLSARQLYRHRRRYLGVILAISLGTAGFITIVTMGRDLKKNFNQDLDLLGGATLIKVQFDTPTNSGPQWFQTEAVKEVGRIPGVSAVSILALKSIVITKKIIYHYHTTLVAADKNYWNVCSLWASKGNLFGSMEEEGRERVCVLGEELATRIFGNQDFIGQFLEIGQEIYKVIGILGGVGVGDRSQYVFMPITSAEDRIPGIINHNRLYLRVQTWDDVERVAEAIPAAILAHQKGDGLIVEVAWERLKRVKRVAWWIEFFIYIAIVATMILGGIGIWNVMMAAVRSRTREIGLKKAMGAEDVDIFKQFLAESLCLTIGAALIGVIIGRVAIEILGYIIGIRPPEELFFICLGLGLLFAVGLGVGAGLYPSIQASRMEVVTAIRYE